jgi:hypothetical protein
VIAIDADDWSTSHTVSTLVTRAASATDDMVTNFYRRNVTANTLDDARNFVPKNCWQFVFPTAFVKE